METKIKVYKIVCRYPYSSDSWLLNDRLKSRIQVIEIKYLKRVDGATKIDRIRNDEVTRKVGIKVPGDIIEE